MKNKLLAQRNAEIVEAYERGGHVADIAVSFEVNPSVVYYAIAEARKNGVVTRTERSSRVPSAEMQERVRTYLALYEDGLSPNEIGKKFGVSGEAVRRAMVRHTGAPLDKRNASHYSNVRYERFVSEHGDAINAAFDETHSMADVMERFSHCSSSHIRQLLQPKAKMIVSTRPTRMVWTKERIVEVLRIAASGSDQLTSNQYEKWRQSGVTHDGEIPPTKLLIAWRFGCWNEAVVAAGLKPTPSRRKVYVRSWNREEALNAVRIYVNESLKEGRRPTSSGYEKWSPSRKDVPCRATISYTCGGLKWSEILREVYAMNESEA